jgi:hypothetical protein
MAKTLKKQCLDLWFEIIKRRAQYRSELSYTPGRQIGGDAILNAHHIFGKKTNRLAFDLDNGICITQGEHMAAHDQTLKWKMEDRIRKTVGEKRWKYLLGLTEKRGITKNLPLVKLYLEQELEKLRS